MRTLHMTHRPRFSVYHREAVHDQEPLRSMGRTNYDGRFIPTMLRRILDACNVLYVNKARTEWHNVACEASQKRRLGKASFLRTSYINPRSLIVIQPATMSRASTAYKKKDGSLAVADDRKFLFWAPSAPPGASPTVTIPVADIVSTYHLDWL